MDGWMDGRKHGFLIGGSVLNDVRKYSNIPGLQMFPDSERLSLYHSDQRSFYWIRPVPSQRSIWNVSHHLLRQSEPDPVGGALVSMQPWLPPLRVHGNPRIRGWFLMAEMRG
ncbi:hypothetical protein AMECASPLE_035981 [Ameca splendens]|uniref:Uncharacterized protein n=1 Tax=Ameca splendens TaxID=208324 RepID=A0ABV1AF37_9TELE